MDIHLTMNPDTFTNFTMNIYFIDDNGHFDFGYEEIQFNFIYGFYPNIMLFYYFLYEMGSPKMTCFYNPVFSAPYNKCEIKPSNIDLLLKENQTIYPNPFIDKFTIDLKNQYSNFCNVSIHNMLGQIIYSETIQSPTTQIDLSNYNSGLYFVKISDHQNNIQTLKIVKD